jgi:crotonobetainyl-CoA:carnitine CoA-transferase CaiB-like acyl-CoA transferase
MARHDALGFDPRVFLTMHAPFEGLSVVDLSERLSGAYAARLFGDFGADVVLVERPDGHVLRREPPFLDDVPGIERSALHGYLNWNKRSVITDQTGDVSGLIDNADVVVTDAYPITAGPFAAALGRMGPAAVHLSITPYGLDSPLTGRAGNDLTASARSGWSYINGYDGEPPLQLPGFQAGYVGGLTGFVAAAAALLHRGSSGRSELVDVSELEALALTVHPWGVAAVYESAGFSFGPAGHHKRGEPGPFFDTSDGRISLAVADFRNWSGAMEVLGLADLALREDLISDIGRHSRDLSAVTAAIASTLPELESWDLFRELGKLRCPSGVVQEIDGLVRDPQLAARDFMVETVIEGRRIRAPGPMARFQPPLWQLARTAPRLDEHGPALRAAADTARRDIPRRRAERLLLRPLAGDPLAGVRVLSLGQAWSGTFGTEILALLGADVVQVSSLDRNDVWRRVRSGVPKGLVDTRRVQHALNTQGLYNSVNLNKREITLDLRREEGRELLWRLLPRFEVLVDNFRPAVLPSWGITLDSLEALRPGMIWASISGYGSDGPYRQYPAIGTTIEPMAGLSSMHGYEGDPGMNTAGLYPDPIGGYFLAAAVVAALNRRDRNGGSQRIDLSMMEAVATVCGDAIFGYSATGRVPKPTGNHHRRVAPHNNYPALNGEWLAIAAENETAWQALVAHIDDVRLCDARFATMALRKANEVDLDDVIGQWSVRQDASRTETVLAALGVSAARIVPLYEIYSRPDPDLIASGFIAAVDHPEAGETWLPGRPWKFSSGKSAPVTAAPCVGQHSWEVLTKELGLSDDDYERLVAGGVTGTLNDVRNR